MISIKNLSVEFGAKSLFEKINYVINPKEKIALVGKNGAGKSTMLKIIAGLQTPSSGEVSRSAGITIGYLPQQMQPGDSVTVIEETRKAFSAVGKIKGEIALINSQLQSRRDYESADYQRLIEQLASLTERLAWEDGGNCEAEMEKTLMGLGFGRKDFTRPTAELSGGWRMRIELAKLLLVHPDLLLLDEPTNHLDIESIQWLECFLIAKANAVVLVSHDRAFMDNVTNRTIEISLGKIYDYSVNYSKYVELHRERVQQQTRAWLNQQKLIRDTEDFIERFRYKATKAVQVQSRIKQLAKIERIEIDEIDSSRINIKFPPAPRSGDFPLVAENVGKSYGDNQVFDGASLSIKRGEKVAFVGKNGEGKTTFVKCIMGEIPYTGTLKIGHNVKTGYFAQNQAQLLDEGLTVFETIDRVAAGEIRTKIRDILGAFMFGAEESEKKVKVLSGGERSRLAMIRLLLEPVNLLILDEPTNHLDIPSKEILKKAIKEFNGTVIVVSHDREFLDGLVEKVYEFGAGKIRECIGGIDEFLEKKRLEALNELGLTGRQAKPSGKASPAETAVPGQESNGKPSYMEQRQREKTLRRAGKKVAEAEAEITALETALARIEERIAAGDVDQSVFTLHAETSRRLETAMGKWEEASMEYDNLKNVNKI